MQKIDIDSQIMFYEVDSFKKDKELLDIIKKCLDVQKQLGMQKLDVLYKRHDKAQHAVSKDALENILSSSLDISDIRTNTDITNCIVFHTKNLDGSLVDEGLIQLRQAADQAMQAKIKQLFASPDSLDVECSGHFWYPPGGFMGWHTNLRKPGWRMYVNYAEEPDKSYFRYRDPDSGAIVTCSDQVWNFRLFKITPDKPFWHCVFSDTNRFSLGYKITDGQQN